jgi:hypothetical protein
VATIIDALKQVVAYSRMKGFSRYTLTRLWPCHLLRAMI